MNNAVNTTFRRIAQEIVCHRYADNDAALADIDTEFQAGKLSEPERKKLTTALKAN